MLPINTEIRGTVESTAINISAFAIDSHLSFLHIFCLNCGKMPEYGGDRERKSVCHGPLLAPCLRTSLAYLHVQSMSLLENLLSPLPEPPAPQ